MVEEDPEGGYTARALGYSIFTEAETIEELKESIRDAIRCHFEKQSFFLLGPRGTGKSTFIKRT